MNQQKQRSRIMTSQLEEEEELELWIQHQIEQQKEDQHNLRMFYEMKQEEANVKKARRYYNRLVKKYIDSLS